MKANGLTFWLGGFILLLFSSCQKENNPFLNSYKENAKLKQIWIYSSLDPKTLIGLQKEYEYDENGNVSRISSPMYVDGKIAGVISYELYEYNSSGQLSEMNEFYNSASDPSGFRNAGEHIYYYSLDGRLEKKTVGTTAGYIRESYFYEYKYGQLMKVKEYNHNDELQSYIENQYDNTGNLVKEARFASDGNCTTYTIHTYSGSQLIKSDEYEYKGDEHIREIKRTYDKNNNLIILESTELTANLYGLSSSIYVNSVLRYEYY